MTEPVEFKFFGSAADVERELIKMERKFESLQEQISQVRRQSKRTSDSAVEGFKSWATSITSVAAVYGEVKQVISQVLELERERNNLLAESERRIDSSLRKLRVQAGLTAVQGTGAQQRAADVAEVYGVDQTVVLDTMRQLVSSGFSQRDAIHGDALISALDTMAATNTLGEPPEDIVRALSKFITVKYGREGLTSENLRNTGTLAANLFQGEDFQLAQFEQLAKNTGVAGRLTESETEAMFSSILLRAGSDESTASTQMRSIVLALQNAKASKPKLEALKTLGLESSDVDIIGESFAEVRQRLQDAISKLAPEDVSPTLTKLFETRNVPAANVLFGERSGFDEFQQAFENPRDIQDLVDIASGGHEARRERIKQIQERQAIASGAEDFAALTELAKQRDIAGGQTAFRASTRQRAAEAARFVGGASPERSLEFGADVSAEFSGANLIRRGLLGPLEIQSRILDFFTPGGVLTGRGSDTDALVRENEQLQLGKNQLLEQKRTNDILERQANRPQVPGDPAAQNE